MKRVSIQGGYEMVDNYFSIGIDFGTESGRVLLVNVHSGSIEAIKVIPYRHGVIEDTLPINKQRIPKGSVLQHPGDYLHVLKEGVAHVLAESKVNPTHIIGIGVDFTSSTIVPVDHTLTPLCFYSNYHQSPHSWVKLWKHHHTKAETEKIYRVATQRKEKWMRKLGYNISEEWMIPKILEVFEQDREIYTHTAYYLEAVDWIVSILASKVSRNNCSLGFKAFWNEKDGYPEEFFTAIDPEFGKTILPKLAGEVKNIGECAGYLTEEWARKLSLPVNLPISTGVIDAHSAVLGTGVYQSGELLMVMGTSTCHMMLHSEEKEIPGISGVVKDAIIPGLYAYEAGQSAVGDLFGSYIKNHVPESYKQEADKQGVSMFDYLEKKAAKLSPGESGLIALDWHNGNRSILSNTDLSGCLIGLTLHTKPEAIFRTYLESTAFGANMIIGAYRDWGMDVREVVACGGLPQANKLLMQLYADILNMPIHVSQSNYAPAIGAAILGAVAAGRINNGYDDMEAAIRYMAQPIEKTYYPIKKHVEVYQQLFAHYKELHDYFGMKRLSMMRNLKHGIDKETETIY